MPKAARIPERDIQRMVVQTLHLRKVFVLSIPNEGKRSWAGGRALASTGLYAGAADLLIIDSLVRPFLLELKALDGKWEEPQISFGNDCLRRGIPYAVAYGYDAAIEQCKQWGVI